MTDFLPDSYFKVIPAKSSGTIYVSFTPLTLSMTDCESRCAGLALGFMSLDSEVTLTKSINVHHYKILRSQRVDDSHTP